MKLGQVANSALIFHDYIVEKIEFSRKGNDVQNIENYNFTLNNEVLESEDKEIFKIFLEIIIEDDDNSIYINIAISGIFGFDEKHNIEESIKKSIVQKNTLAILFPYLRSLVSTISSNAGIKPIIIPAVNINLLLENKGIENSEG